MRWTKNEKAWHKMIGFYDYTVIMTYLGLLSGAGGLWFVFAGYPQLAIFCLLFCGLCDMFDGKIARTKAGRTEQEKQFGIQIDSLSDMVCFGVLPAAIAVSVCNSVWAFAAAGIYVLTALIRLAYYNVTEQDRQQKTAEARRTYEGLPVTSAALIFPLLYCLRMVFGHWFGKVYAIVLVCTAICFVAPFHLKKPQMRQMVDMLFFGVVIAGVLVLRG